MIDLIVYFGWDHDLYGRSGIDEFHHLAKSNGLCIDINKGIEDSFTLSNYTTLANYYDASYIYIDAYLATGHIDAR